LLPGAQAASPLRISFPAALPDAIMARRHRPKNVQKDSRKLGSSGLTTGRLSLGCGTFGREIDQDASYAIMDRALELGMRLFDTAESYGGGESRQYRRTFYGVEDTREVSHEMHSSEKIVGRWLHSRGVRKEVTLVTKVWENYTPAHLMEAIEGSLERLRTDFVDIYLFHRYFAATPLEEAVAAMDAVVSSGLARAGGASNFSFEQLRDALEISRRSGLQPFQVIENNYNLAAPDLAREILPLASREQIGVLTYSPLGAGFLTGKYTPDRLAFPKGSRFDVIPGHADVYFSERNFRVVERLAEMSGRLGIPVPRLAVAWVLRNPSVDTVLVGARTIAHLENAVEALQTELTPEWYEEMNSLN
jgi:aryl-alcohol dehydrogenase-like predicted oxidoreductase